MHDAEPNDSATSRPAFFSRLALSDQYRDDHQNPVNHFLHVGVGWPAAAIAVVLSPFRPLWGVGLFLAAYAVMFFGHFVFERNIPTVLKHPSTPFVVAAQVVRRMASGLVRLATGARAG